MHHAVGTSTLLAHALRESPIAIGLGTVILMCAFRAMAHADGLADILGEP